MNDMPIKLKTGHFELGEYEIIIQRSKVDWKLAKEMRDKYMKINDIAKHFKVSPTRISQGFKLRDIK